MRLSIRISESEKLEKEKSTCYAWKSHFDDCQDKNLNQSSFETVDSVLV